MPRSVWSLLLCVHLLLSCGGPPPAGSGSPAPAVILVSGECCQPGAVQHEDDTLLLPFVCVALDAGFDRIRRLEDGGLSVSDGERSVTAAPGLPYLAVEEADETHYIWADPTPRADLDEILVPLEPLCRALGLQSTAIAESAALTLSEAEPLHFPRRDPLTVLWLARVVWAEARGECLRGRVAVAQVVLNRIASPYYPDSITGVIFQPAQFSTVKSGAIWNDPSEDCILAALLALDGADVVGPDCLYFNSNPGRTRGLTYLLTIGGHNFYAR